MALPKCTHPEHADYAGRPYDVRTMNRVCWLYHNNPEAKRAADLAISQQLPPRRQLTREEKAAAAKDAEERAARQRNGPGTKQKELLAALGLSEKPGCPCEKRRRLMNAWGVSGCRERRAEIVAWLKEAASDANWGEWYRAAKALAGQDWFLVTDPYGSIVDEAIRRAAAHQWGSTETQPLTGNTT